MIKLNSQLIEFKSFPNGEALIDGEQLSKIVLPPIGLNNLISFKYENDGDLFKLFLIKSYLDDQHAKTDLVITYMPYSRMDRVEGNSVFTLKYATNFINTMNFNTISVVEPHSDVTMALLNRSKAIYPTILMLDEVLEKITFDKERDYLCFPDQGAQKRYGKKRGDYRQLVGFKERNFGTGKIEKLKMIGDVEGKNFKVLIVDDLCSYGNTFFRSAKALRDAGASKVYLLVTCRECHLQR
jgi:ribose-phosphate pyrophosphokinase